MSLNIVWWVGSSAASEEKRWDRFWSSAQLAAREAQQREHSLVAE